MITNADITIYNKNLELETKMDTWKRTVIRGVSFYSDIKVSLDSNGLATADIYKVRIPEECCDGYVPEDKYLGEDGTWTVRNDDYIVLGESSLEIERPKDLKGTHFRINSWSDNRRGSLPHIRIGGS